MQKLCRVLIFVFTVLALSCTPVFAEDVAPDFTAEFFPDGKISAPEELDLHIYKDYDGNRTDVRLWQSLPEDLWKYYTSIKYYDYDTDAFAEKYGLKNVHRTDGICHQLMTEAGYENYVASCITSFGNYSEILETWHEFPELEAKIRENLFSPKLNLSVISISYIEK